MLHIIGRQFRRPSGLLGRAVSGFMKKMNIFCYKKLVPGLNIQPGDHLLEIGYGPGAGIDYILSKYDCHITGIDFSKLMYKEAIKRNNHHILQNKVSLHHGDFLNFNIYAGFYDKIFCINVVYFWDDPVIPFLKIHEGLRENGIFHFYMAHADHLNKIRFTKDGIFNKYSIEDITGYLQKAGFRNIEYTQDDGYYVKCQKQIV